jgi:hypothetical protein
MGDGLTFGEDGDEDGNEGDDEEDADEVQRDLVGFFPVRIGEALQEFGDGKFSGPDAAGARVSPRPAKIYISALQGLGRETYNSA